MAGSDHVHTQGSPRPSALVRTDSPSANFSKKFAETDGHVGQQPPHLADGHSPPWVGARGHGRPGALGFPGADISRSNPRTSAVRGCGRTWHPSAICGRISRFDGMVMWHKLCRKLFHEKKANVLMQVAVGLRALPHSTIVRACTEPDGHCFFLARTTTRTALHPATHGCQTRPLREQRYRAPFWATFPNESAPHGRRIPRSRSKEHGERRKGIGRHFCGAKRRLTEPDPATRGGQTGPPRVVRSGASRRLFLAPKTAPRRRPIPPPAEAKLGPRERRDWAP